MAGDVESHEPYPQALRVALYSRAFGRARGGRAGGCKHGFIGSVHVTDLSA